MKDCRHANCPCSRSINVSPRCMNPECKFGLPKGEGVAPLQDAPGGKMSLAEARALGLVEPPPDNSAKVAQLNAEIAGLTAKIPAPLQDAAEHAENHLRRQRGDNTPEPTGIRTVTVPLEGGGRATGTVQDAAERERVHKILHEFAGSECGDPRFCDALDHTNAIVRSRPQVVVDAAERERAETAFSGIFDRLERCTPIARAELFYTLEGRWCWDCGHPQLDDVHGECSSLVPARRPQVGADEIERAVREALCNAFGSGYADEDVVSEVTTKAVASLLEGRQV